MWGWVADYPDPENFLFLLWSPMARSAGGPNTANFDDPTYDATFVAMRDRPNDAERLRLIRKLVAIVERERPWIELFYPESYTLTHGWVRNAKPLGMSFSTLKYRDLDPAQRQELRREWNRPVLWPAWALAVVAVIVIAPGIATVLRGRR
jgi:ABC-type oligopeptide transport system substrate-binding subunit